MKVIIDLMEAYADHVGLPLLLVNLNGDIDYRVDEKDRVLLLEASPPYLSELQNISLHINTPTVVSVSDESYMSGLFFVVSPAFKVNDAHNFLAAGPFLVEATRVEKANNQNDYLPVVLREEEIADKIRKVRKLYHLLVNKAQAESTISIPAQITYVLQSLGDLEYDILDYNQYLSNILDELINIESFDFLGLAIKNEHDVFIIQHICGDEVQHLAEKGFYMGEGLLGKAVILGEDFHWSKGVDNQRIDFFNRYYIFPNHLFGFTLKQTDDVTGMLFGGSFKENGISHSLLNLLKCIVRVFSQRRNLDTKLIDSYYIQTIFANWLDLMDVMASVKDRKHVSYKILDFCQTLNNGRFSCFSTVGGDFISRGEMRQEIMKTHNSNLAKVYDPFSANLWIDQHCIHFYLHFNQQLYGLFTVEFDETADLQQSAYILGMVENLLKQAGQASVNIVPSSSESVFQLLQTSMREMNKNQYHVSDLAINVVSKLMNLLQITADKKELLVNICRVFPYNFDYLEKHIAHTEEWQLLLETKRILQDNVNVEEYNIEAKILAFIYIKIIKGDQKDSLDFLSVDLKELCMNTYAFSLKSLEPNEETFKGDIDHEQIKELMDLKGVIETLNLTAREKEILHLILEGLNNHEVGQYLKISIHTVKNHVTNIFKKLNVSDRLQAMAKIYRIKYDEG